MEFRVDLNIFRGPMDLLLYLVRKHEVEIVDIPIAPITDQFLQYFAVLEQLDVNAVGDFLAMASLLIEIKSQQVLPRADEVEEPLDDPRQELVRSLLEYKKFRDAASMLEDRSRAWQQHYPRLASDLPAREREPGRGAIREVELGPGQRVRPDRARQRGRQAGQHRLRRYADPRLHCADPRPAGRAGVCRSAICSSRACTSRPWWASFWPCWNWCGTTRSASIRTSCLAKSGCFPVPNAAKPWTFRT